ncbi:replication protein RepA [Promicromonospora sp. Marseille-Q5078]
MTTPTETVQQRDTHDDLPAGLVSLAREHAADTGEAGDREVVPLPGVLPPQLPEAKRTQLRITSRQRNVVDAKFAIENQRAADAGEIGYAARIWTQLALPYTDPGPVSRWERRNGDLALVVRPATLVATDGTTSDGYPFGALPRYVLSWMATEAVRTQSPCLDVGRSFNDFMKRLGLGHNGRDAKRLKDQIYRLVGATMQVQQVRKAGENTHVHGEHFTVASSFDLWLPAHDDVGEDQGVLWNNTVTLSEAFFSSIIEAPVPVDLRALRALRGAPMRLDIYTWLTHRLGYMSGSTLVPWPSLAVQFGGQFSRPRKFKETFVKNLITVAELYPAARFSVEDPGLLLFPSAPHVERRQRRALGS